MYLVSLAPAGGEVKFGHKRFGANRSIGQDGSFRCEDVPPGEYDLFVTVKDADGPLDGPDIGRVSRRIVVPPAATAAVDTPHDLGRVEMEQSRSVGASHEDHPMTEDEAAIRGLIPRAMEAWNRGDGDAYAALFTEEADYVNFGGMHARGRGAIAAQHQALFDGPLKGSRLKLRITGVRFLRPDVALLHAEGGILEPGQTDPEVSPTRNSYQTAVVTKDADGWRVAAIQVTRIQPMGPPNGQP